MKSWQPQSLLPPHWHSWVFAPSWSDGSNASNRVLSVSAEIWLFATQIKGPLSGGPLSLKLD